jgi:hypothetical protein
MKLVLILLVLVPVRSWARDAMAIMGIEDKQVSGACAVHHKDLPQKIQKQVTSFFASFPEFSVVKTEARARYLVTGSVRSVENCHGKRAKDETAKVAIQLNVFDRRLNKWTFSYTSQVSAAGPGVLAETMNLVVRDVTFRVERALAYRSGEVRIVDRNAKKRSPHNYDLNLIDREVAARAANDGGE